MPELNPALRASEPNTTVLEKLAVLERICLAAVIAITILNLALWSLPSTGSLFIGNLRLMSGGSIVASLLSALSLYFSASLRSEQLRRLGLLIAVLATLFYTANFVFYLMLPSLGIDFPIPSSLNSLQLFARGISPQSTSSFALLGLTTILLSMRNRVTVLVADLVTAALVLLVLTLLWGQVISMMPLFGPPANLRSSFQTMICVLLLTEVVFFRRAQSGFFSILIGRGTGSRLARTLIPILLFLPYVREITRARFINWERMPAQYITAVLATLAVIFSVTLLLYFCWRINSMEVETHALSLRDELTGLYNLRGFRLLAEQALRMAHRSGHSYSVLFVDLDDLKRINDVFGHPAGSRCLAETGDLLKAAFRESDVIGRVGGDEFAVAGVFSSSAIRTAAERLEELAALRSVAENPELALAFSIGHVTAEAGASETLDTLLAKADQAMYEEKRRKKVLAT